MNLKSMKFQILLVSTLLFTIWSQGQTFQIEELPEDNAAVFSGVSPYEESDECKAMRAAETAEPPKFDRPPFGYDSYEQAIRLYEPIAGPLTQFDQEKYDALVKECEKRGIERGSRILEIHKNIEMLELDLREARNKFTDKKRIAELESKINAARREMEKLWTESQPSSVDPECDLRRMDAARRVLDAKRAQTLLVLWQEYENISKSASLAETRKDQELNSVKAEFEKEKARFTQEYIKQKQESDRTALKLESADVNAKLKNRLQKFICWPDVQTFDKYLQDVIQRQRKESKTSLVFGSDFEVEEIPEDGENVVDQNKSTTKNFTGKWESSYGTLTLSQGGTAVSGSSDYYSTQVNGSIKEDGKLHFTWSDSNNKKGVGIFELSSDGQTFSGTWNYLLSDGKTLGLGGTWGGRRID